MHRTGYAAVGWVVVCLCFTTPLWAFSVGEITVKSHQGAPFLATVPLALQSYERSRAITAALGGEEAYSAEGIKRAPVLDRLQVKVVLGPPDLVRIVSQRPIHTPAFDLLLLVRTGQVTIVKTYRVVLPPAPVPARTVAALPTPPSASRTKSRTGKRAALTQSAAKRGVAAALSVPWIHRLPKRYGPVKRGETLYSVVRTLGVPSKWTWRTVVVIWQTNKHRFSHGNMHGLHVGAYLTIPTNLAQKLATLSKTEAQRIVAEQWEAWQTLQNVDLRRQRIALARPQEKNAADTNPLPPSQTVVLPPEGSSAAVSVTELRTALRSLEDRFIPQPVSGRRDQNPVGFVSSTELQMALQRLEERLMQRFQQTLVQAQAAPQPARSASVRVSSPSRATSPSEASLQQILPATPYILILENALLLLFAITLAWRWYRRSR